MSMSEALELYQIDDRNEYTIELKGKMEKLGISEVPVLSVDGELFEFASAIQWVNNQ